MQDLDEARAALETLLAEQAAYVGNNLNRFAEPLAKAREQVSSVERALKAAGLLEMSPQEALAARLDAAFPKARPKDVVTFEGARYQRLVTALERAPSGQVIRWDRGWSLVTARTPRAEDL